MSKITIVSKPERFRRAGLAFTRTPTEVDTSVLSSEQLESLRRECGPAGMLAVVEGQIPMELVSNELAAPAGEKLSEGGVQLEAPEQPKAAEQPQASEKPKVPEQPKAGKQPKA